MASSILALPRRNRVSAIVKLFNNSGPTFHGAVRQLLVSKSNSGEVCVYPCVHIELSTAFDVRGDVRTRFAKGKIQISDGLSEFVLQNWYFLVFGLPDLDHELSGRCLR